MEIALYALVFVAVGVVMYFVDRHWGTSFYRWGWNLWHKLPLSPELERGFIVGCTTRERVMPAIVLTVISCLVLHRLGEHDAVTLLLKGAILMFPGILIGFLLTGLAMREGKTRTMVDKVFETMDRVEKGEVGLGDVAESALGQAGALGQRVVEATKQKVAGMVKAPAESPVVEPAKQPEEPTAAPVKPKRSFNDALSDYSKRR